MHLEKVCVVCTVVVRANNRTADSGNTAVGRMSLSWGGTETVRKSRSHFKILGPKRVTWNKFRIEDPQILGVAVANLVARDLSNPAPNVSVSAAVLWMFISWHWLVCLGTTKSVIAVRDLCGGWVREIQGSRVCSWIECERLRDRESVRGLSAGDLGIASLCVDWEQEIEGSRVCVRRLSAGDWGITSNKIK